MSITERQLVRLMTAWRSSGTFAWLHLYVMKENAVRARSALRDSWVAIGAFLLVLDLSSQLFVNQITDTGASRVPTARLRLTRYSFVIFLSASLLSRHLRWLVTGPHSEGS